MDIGQLRHRITFLQMIQGRDNNTGAEVNTIKESDPVWALVEFQEVGSTERQEADQTTAMTAAKVTLRYKRGITPEMEFVFDDLKFKILSVLPDPKKCYLTLEAVQVGAYREQALTDQDGQTLIDGDGNALLFGNNSEGGSYRAPALTFTNSEDESFTPT